MKLKPFFIEFIIFLNDNFLYNNIRKTFSIFKEIPFEQYHKLYDQM